MSERGRSHFLKGDLPRVVHGPLSPADPGPVRLPVTFPFDFRNRRISRVLLLKELSSRKGSQHIVERKLRRTGGPFGNSTLHSHHLTRQFKFHFCSVVSGTVNIVFRNFILYSLRNRV